MTSTAATDATVTRAASEDARRVLTPDALHFLQRLHTEFEPSRRRLLHERQTRWHRLQDGGRLDFLPETGWIRAGDWHVAPAPRDLDDRRVEITGPAERKMMINALNSGAKVFMADLEDALSPTWDNIVAGQANLMDAVRRTLAFEAPDGRHYALADRTATLVVRPRGWHLVESHLLVGGEPISASLFDFGLYLFHNAKALMERGTGPYFYLPKTERHEEVRLWNDVFRFAQDALGVPRGTIRATVLIETIFAAFEMDEILYELREHAAGLNAGRWDYLFSIIKAFRTRPDCVLPDRAQLTMTVPFMRAYSQLLIQVCHRRGAHAIGGMAAVIPSRHDAAVTDRAIARVREDKEREAADGYDGTWIAHPDLVPVVAGVFDRVLAGRRHQKDCLREDLQVGAAHLVDLAVPDAAITLAGVETNVDVALRYLESWLRGQGAAAIHHLMEDTATAEISRSQLWQWLRHEARIADDGTMSAQGYRATRDRVLAGLRQEDGDGRRWDDAAALLDLLVLGEFQDFLTIPAYRLIA